MHRVLHFCFAFRRTFTPPFTLDGQWGIPGLLLSLFISSMAGNLVNQYVLNKKYGVALDLNYTSRVAVFSSIGAVITGQTLLFFVGSSDLVKVLGGGILFLATCLVLAPLTRAIELGDIALLKRVLRRVRFVYPIIAPFLVLEEKMIRRFSRRARVPPCAHAKNPKN